MYFKYITFFLGTSLCYFLFQKKVHFCLSNYFMESLKYTLLKCSTQHLACLESEEKHAQRVFPQLNPQAPGVSERMWIKVWGNDTNVVLRYDWWTHDDGWLLSERKNLSRRAVQIATKWCKSLNCGHHAINNTTQPVEGLLFESWNRGKERKGRKGTLSLITVTGRFLLLQAAERGDRESDASLWLRCQPQMSAQCYLSAPSLALFEREKESILGPAA